MKYLWLALLFLAGMGGLIWHMSGSTYPYAGALRTVAAVAILLDLGVIYLIGARLGRVPNGKKKPPAEDPKEDPAKTATEPEKPVKKVSGHGDDHHGHGDSLFTWAFKLAFLLLLAGLGYWFIWVLNQHVPSAERGVQVWSAGPDSVLVSGSQKLDMDDSHYCQAPPDNAREYPASSEWSETVSTSKSKFCSSPSPQMGGFKPRCKAFDGSPWATCGTQYVAVQFTTETSRKVWIEPLKYR